MLGAVDTAVIGHLENASNLAAVAIGSTIIQFLYWSFGFLRMGISGMVGQAYGANTWSEVGALFLRGTLICGLLGILIWIFQIPIFSFAIELFDGSEQTNFKAAEYFYIRIWSAPAVLLNYCIIGWLVGVQNTRTILILQVFMNGLNILLDLYLVIGLGLGVSGVAVATLISECLACIVGVLVVRSHIKRFLSKSNLGQFWKLEIFQRMFNINFNLFIRTVCLLFAFSYFTSKASKYGDVTIAAHLVLMQFQQFLSFGLDAFAHAAEALVSKFIGANNKAGLIKTVKLCTQWAVIAAIGFTVIYATLGKNIINTLTNIHEVRSFASNYLLWILISPIISVWSFILDGIFIGATKSQQMRNGMLLSLIAFFASIHLLDDLMGYSGLWLSFIIFMFFRGATLGIAFPLFLKDSFQKR